MTQSPVTSHKSLPRTGSGESRGGQRPPAYAKRLLALRRAGHHPLFIEVVFGDDWAEPQRRALLESATLPSISAKFKPYGLRWVAEIGHPMLAVRPREYRPGVFDWHCVVGSNVLVIAPFVQTLGVGAISEKPTEAALQLAGEIARWSWVSFEGGMPLRYYAHKERHEGQWPSWWSDELDRADGGQFERWKAAAAGIIAAERRAVAA